jgi:molybdopterin-guanine dinucleotide biosynthesis protein A
LPAASSRSANALAELDTAVVELPLERLANVNTVAELQRLASRPGA